VSFAIYLAGLALIAAVAWVAASPLFSAALPPLPDEASPDDERMRHRKNEALAAIREADFDRELGKLSEADHRELRARLEAEALAAIAALEGKGHGNAR
jgi:hypothetical protein